MDYEYVESIAAQLKVDGRCLGEIIDQLGIRTLETAVPPYGVEVSAAVSYEDAERLRRYFAATVRLHS
jgi:hypothetical protein